jgi:hypothetical protein
MIKKNLNDLNLHQPLLGNERRLEMFNDIVANGVPLPKAVTYQDIDDDFKRWVNEDLVIVDDNGNKFPTMSLFSNQRFSEYSQSWSFTDKNNNLLLNFKTVTRENNPQYGKIQGGLWNIPGDRFYTMQKVKHLDENGTESLLVFKMREPVAVDFKYKLTIFATKFQYINDFNTIMVKKFAARQCYIRPNGHYMSMILEGINDESEYNIDDRQFYSQSYDIKVMGYILTEDDFRVYEEPLKQGFSFMQLPKRKKKTSDVEIEETKGKYFDEISLEVTFPKNSTKTEFTIDTDFIVKNIELENVTKNYRIIVKDDELQENKIISFKENDKIKITINKRNPIKESKLILKGIKQFDKNLINSH